MREKIAELLDESVDDYYRKKVKSITELTDQILSLICEEIEKVENPYIRLEKTIGKRFTFAFEDCRQKILSLLRPIKNPVGDAEL